MKSIEGIIADFSTTLSNVKQHRDKLVQEKINLYRAAIDIDNAIESIKKELHDAISKKDEKMRGLAEALSLSKTISEDIDSMIQLVAKNESEFEYMASCIEEQIDSAVSIMFKIGE